MVDVKPRDSRCHIHVKAIIIDLGHNVGDEMMGQAGRPPHLTYPALSALSTCSTLRYRA